MDYSELQELLSAVTTVDQLLALNELLEIHAHVASLPSLLSINEMSRYSNETNSRVDRSAAERLQEKLFVAAETALDQAIESGVIPAALLSSTQNILRDAGLNPDLSGGDSERSSDGPGVSPNWLKELSNDLGL